MPFLIHKDIVNIILFVLLSARFMSRRISAAYLYFNAPRFQDPLLLFFQAQLLSPEHHLPQSINLKSAPLASCFTHTRSRTCIAHTQPRLKKFLNCRLITHTAAVLHTHTHTPLPSIKKFTNLIMPRKSTIHHCPKQSKGGCAPGYKTPKWKTPYCNNHQTYCRNCPEQQVHLKTEPCYQCGTAKEQEERRKAKAEREKNDKRVAEQIEKNKGKKK
ncbi:hypothetical protein B0J14DRAFT_657621 [Halenospora varia]|nr:hypothetical protein B0J14DRAFT_657621 [Halenospora varia]